MELNSNQTKGIYSLTYGYSDHKINFISTREEFEKFQNYEINLETSQHSYEDISLSDEIIESEGLVYKFTEGFKVMDIHQGEIAEIEEVVEFPQQEMAYVTYNDKTILLPLHPNFIVEIDRENKIITMNLPEGLLDL